MIAIRDEIARSRPARWPQRRQPAEDRAAHRGRAAAADWTHAYSREVAAYPVAVAAAQKYWPPVGRVDNVYGDRNLFCACPPVSEYEGS